MFIFLLRTRVEAVPEHASGVSEHIFAIYMIYEMVVARVAGFNARAGVNNISEILRLSCHRCRETVDNLAYLFITILRFGSHLISITAHCANRWEERMANLRI